MKALLTPKELAIAIGVSESSMRRWVDSGLLKMSRTAGGHRRIPIAEVIRFIRESGATVVHPDALGLSELGPQPFTPAAERDNALLLDAIENGRIATARGFMISWYASGQELTALFDGPVRTAMHRVGELWTCDPGGIIVEHRATDTCLRAVHQLRQVLPAPLDAAPVAIGGAPAGDPYLIPTAMAAMIFDEAGFRDINLGPEIPLPLLADAARSHAASVVWLSVTSSELPDTLRGQIESLAKQLAGNGIPLVIGGAFAQAHAPKRRTNLTIVQNMKELSAFARGLNAATNRESGK